MVLKLSSGVPAPSSNFAYYLAAASTNTLAGGANTRVVNSTITVVGFVGNGGTLTINGVDGGTSGGTKLLSIDYINGDFTMTNTACSNCRNAYLSVNGGTAVQVQMPISAQVGLLCSFFDECADANVELGHPVLRVSCFSFWIQTRTDKHDQYI